MGNIDIDRHDTISKQLPPSVSGSVSECVIAIASTELVPIWRERKNNDKKLWHFPNQFKNTQQICPSNITKAWPLWVLQAYLCPFCPFNISPMHQEISDFFLMPFLWVAQKDDLPLREMKSAARPHNLRSCKHKISWADSHISKCISQPEPAKWH